MDTPRSLDSLDRRYWHPRPSRSRTPRTPCTDLAIHCTFGWTGRRRRRGTLVGAHGIVVIDGRQPTGLSLVLRRGTGALERRAPWPCSSEPPGFSASRRQSSDA